MIRSCWRVLFVFLRDCQHRYSYNFQPVFTPSPAPLNFLATPLFYTHWLPRPWLCYRPIYILQTNLPIGLPKDTHVCPTVLMKRDRREWFANSRDGTGREWFTFSLDPACPVERDGTGFHFHSRVPIYCGCSKWEIDEVCQMLSEKRRSQLQKTMTAADPFQLTLTSNYQVFWTRVLPRCCNRILAK